MGICAEGSKRFCNSPSPPLWRSSRRRTLVVPTPSRLPHLSPLGNPHCAMETAPNALPAVSDIHPLCRDAPAFQHPQLAFPSPADENFSLEGPEDAVYKLPAPTSLLDQTAFIPQAVPPVASPGGPLSDTPTPLQETQPDIPALGIHSAILPPADVATPPLVKAAHNLRLPSFDLLGIAAPHPDRIGQNTDPLFPILGAGPLSKPEDPLHALSPAQKRIPTYIPTFTPPDHSPSCTINWGAFPPIVRTAVMESPPTSDPESNRTPELGNPSSDPASHPLGQNPPAITGESTKSWLDSPVNTIC